MKEKCFEKVKEGQNVYEEEKGNIFNIASDRSYWLLRSIYPNIYV